MHALEHTKTHYDARIYAPARTPPPRVRAGTNLRDGSETDGWGSTSSSRAAS